MEVQLLLPGESFGKMPANAAGGDQGGGANRGRSQRGRVRAADCVSTAIQTVVGPIVEHLEKLQSKCFFLWKLQLLNWIKNT